MVFVLKLFCSLKIEWLCGYRCCYFAVANNCITRYFFLENFLFVNIDG